MAAGGLIGWLAAVTADLAARVATFDPLVVTASDAAIVTEHAAALRRAAGALEVLAAGRAAEGQAWRASGASSPTAWLAATAGISTAEAAAELSAAGALTQAPEVEAALRSGTVSASQAAVIAPAAAADRAAAPQLVQAASTSTLEELRRRSRQVRAAADAAEAADAAARVHAGRFLRTWTDDEGAWCGRWRLTALDGAKVAAVLEHFHDRVFEEARSSGRRERADALEADALVAMASAAAGSAAAGSGVRATVIARVDLAALERGATVAGETCAVDGIGPVPVPAVRSLLADAVLVALATEGERIVDVRLAGRVMPARMRHAVAARDGGRCVIPGCGAGRHLEVHHLVPVGEGGATFLDGLATLCRFHHDAVTHRGAVLERDPVAPGAPGGWRYTSPPWGSPGDPDVGPFDDDGLDLRPERPPPQLQPA